MADKTTFLTNPGVEQDKPGFISTVLDQAGQSLLPQAFGQLMEELKPAQPGYRVSPEELKGYEPYIEWFTDSQSEAQTSALKTRIAQNEAASQRIGRNGSLWTGLAAAALDPINYAIPFGAARGMGLVKGALSAGGTNAVGAGLQTWATTKVSPTEHLSDAPANALYAGLFAGVLGGYIGRSGRGVAQEMGTFMAREAQAQDARVGGVSLESTAPDAVRRYDQPQPDVARGAGQADQVGGGVAREIGGAPFEAGGNVIQFPGAHMDPNMPVASAAHAPGEGQMIVGNLVLKLEQELHPNAKAETALSETLAKEPPKKKGGGGKGGGDEPPKGPDDPLVPANNGGVFKVEPTGPDGYGLAPAYGLEKLIAKLTQGTNMIAYGVKSAGDLLQRMIGEGSVLTTDNLKGIATPNSVLLASKQWQAIAQDTMSDMKRIWTELRGHGAGLELGGLNVSATGTQIADAYRARKGSANPDNMPTWGQFKDILHGARMANDPAAYLASLDPSIAPFVSRALPLLDRFFDQTGKEAVRLGLIKTKEFVKDAVARDRRRIEMLSGRIEELQTKPELTANETAELHYNRLALSSKMDQLSKQELSNVIDNQDLADKINDIQERGEARKEAAGDLLNKIKTQLATHFESQMAVKANFEERLARGDTLTDKQFKYLTDLRTKYPDGQASAPRDIVDAYKLSNPLEPFVRNDPRFDPPANEEAKLNLVVDRWQDRQREGTLADGSEKRAADFFEANDMPDAAAAMRLSDGEHPDFPALADSHIVNQAQEIADNLVNALAPERAGELSKIARAFVLGDDALATRFNFDALPSNLRSSLNVLENETTEMREGLKRALSRTQDLKLKYETGKPLLADVFHGTNFSGPEIGFSDAERGKNTGVESAKEAHFFGRDPRTAQGYTMTARKGATAKEIEDELTMIKAMGKGDQPQTILARIRMDNPMVVDMAGMPYTERKFTQRIQDAKAAGHDGVVFTNTKDGGPQDVIYGVFDTKDIRYRHDPGVIKSVEAQTGVKIESGSSRPTPANDRLSAEQLASAKQRELMADLQARVDGPALTKMQQAYVNDMLDQIESGRIELHGPGHDPNFLPRVWDHDAINDAPAELVKIFEDRYRAMGEIDPKKQAADTVASIQSHDPATQIADNNGKSRTFRPSSSNARVLDIPTELVRKFVVTDVEHLVHDYARAYGAGIESAKAFGDPFAHDALNDVRIQAARELKGTADQIISKVDEIHRQMEFARDAMLGRQRAGSPLTVDQAIARVTKNFVSTTSLGGVGFTAVQEAARPLMTRGMLDVFGATFDILGARKTPEMMQMNAQFRALLGEFGELAHGTTASRVMESGGWASRVGSPTAMAIDRKAGLFNEVSEKGFYVANGLAAVTDFLKNWSMYVSIHFMIEDVKAVAAGTATKKQIANLAGYTIDANAAQRMMATDAFAKSGRVNIVDLGKFNDPELVSKFGQSVHMEIRRTINTPGYFDKSMIQQGFYFDSKGNRKEAALATLPFQFMAWGVSANNKVLMSALQGRDASAFMGAASLIGMAYFINNLKYGGGMQWQNMDQYDKMLMAVEQSGVLAQFSDLNGLIETASQGTFGARPLLGMEPKWGRDPSSLDAGALPFGAAGSKALDIYKMFDPQSPQDEWNAAGRRIIPFGGLPYTKGLIKGALDTAAWPFQ